jgi:hypothetical protein
MTPFSREAEPSAEGLPSALGSASRLNGGGYFTF